jgi:GTPase involved in cell partitioning and DNA repair
VLDGAGSEGRSPKADMNALVTELRLHDEFLPQKPSLMFVNKVDLQNGNVWVYSLVWF